MRWRYENEYPLNRTEWTRYYLRSAGVKHGKGSDFGTISIDPPKQEEPDTYSVPESTELLLAGKPVLSYSTPPLKSKIRIYGPLSIILYGSSTSQDTVWFVKLLDISPSGKQRLLTQGVLRASYRALDESKSTMGRPFHPFKKRRLLASNTIYEFQIELMPIFHTFKKDHRMRVDIASDDLTHYGALHTLDIEELPMPSRNSVYHNSRYPSHLLLPVIPDAPVFRKVEPPLSNIAWSFTPGTSWPSTQGWPLVRKDRN